MPRRIIVGLLLLSLTLTAAGFYFLSFFEGAPTPELQNYAPPDVDVYVSVFLSPSTAQQSALRDLFGDEEGAVSTIEALIDSVLSRFDMRFAEDVRPWVGEEVGAFLMGTDYVFLFEAEDEDAAVASAERMLAQGSADPVVRVSYEGTPFDLVKSFGGTGLPLASGLLGDALLIGTPGGLRSAIDTAGGRSLGDDDRSLGETSPLTADRLVALYVRDPDSVVSKLPGALNFAFGVLGVEGPRYRAVVIAESDALVVESTVREPLRLSPQILSGFLSFEF
jgi:hypothetical protein